MLFTAIRLPCFLSTMALLLQPTEAASSPSCSFVISSGDAALGIRVASDSTCASGGVGCINGICRFCRTLDNDASRQFIPCSSFASVIACTVSQGDYDVGVNAIADATCVNGGLGCYNAQCRYCRFQDTPQSAYLNVCPSTSSSTTPTPVTLTPEPTTPTPAPTPLTSAPATPAPTPTPVPSAMASPTPPKTPVPVTPEPTPMPATSTPVTPTPAPDPTAIPSSVTTTPPTAPAITLTCFEIVSTGDAAFGIDIVTDISCFEGGAGCFNNVCRYCKQQTTTRSAAFVDCSSVDSTAGSDINFVPLPVFPETPTPTPTSTVTVPTMQVSTVESCLVSSGDTAAGIGAFADVSCATGGLGCYSQTCRFCQHRLTEQSTLFDICPSTVQMLRAAAAWDQTNNDAHAFSATDKSSLMQWGVSAGVAGVGVAGLVAALAYTMSFRRLVRRGQVLAAATESGSDGIIEVTTKAKDPAQEESV